MIRAVALSLFVFAPGPLWALTLEVPSGSSLTAELVEQSGTRAIPTGPTENNFTPTVLARGTITMRSYALRRPSEDVPPPTTTDLIAPIEEQLKDQGYRVLFACKTRACGGFDFRFGLELIPPPEMFVDLGDFQFLSAISADGTRYVSAISSRGQTTGYLQVTQVLPAGERVEVTTTAPPPRAATGEIGTALENQGRAVLEDLVFSSGTSNLPDDRYASLTALAAYLLANPSRQVALVGHTDASGSLEINLDISQQRAAAARSKLIEHYGVPATQVSAEGMGYLAPRTTNLTKAGREANRRVEAVLTTTE